MQDPSHRRRRRLRRRPHRAGGGARRARRPRLPRLRVPGRADHRPGPARAAARPRGGYDPLLAARMRAVLPACRRQGIRIVTNMGAANPRRGGAARGGRWRAAWACAGCRVAAVTGDDVLDRLRGRRPRARRAAARWPPSATGSSRPTPISGRPDRGGARGGRRGGDHRPGRRSRAVPRPAAARVRLGRGRLDAAGARAPSSGTSSNARGRSPAATSPIPGVKDVPDLARLGFPLAEVSRGRHGDDHEGAGLGRRG